MAEPSYADVWKQHQILLHNQQLAAAEQKVARADHDLAKQNLDQNRDTAVPEQRQDLEKKFFDSQAVLEQKTDKYVEAQTAVAQLQLQHPDHAAALEQNIPPKESLQERLQPVIDSAKDAAKNTVDTGMNLVMAASVGVIAGSVDLPAMPVDHQVVTKPPIEKPDLPDRLPKEEGRQTQEAFRKESELNENLNKAVDNAPRSGMNPGEPKAESMTIEAKGSATFGAQGFGNAPDPFPHRVAANDNDPPNKGPAAAAALPANDNQKPADAVAAQPAVSARVAADFGAPLPPPPPPPPPPPLSQEQGISR